jgi:hypothetical protein
MAGLKRDRREGKRWPTSFTEHPSAQAAYRSGFLAGMWMVVQTDWHAAYQSWKV